MAGSPPERRRGVSPWLVSRVSTGVAPLLAGLVYFLFTQRGGDGQDGGAAETPLAPGIVGLALEPAGRIATLQGRVVLAEGAAGDLIVDWGDGSTPQRLQLELPSQAFRATHAYAADGTYTVTVEAASVGGRSAFGAVTAVIPGSAVSAAPPGAGGAASAAAGGAAPPGAGGAASPVAPTATPTPTVPYQLLPGTWVISLQDGSGPIGRFEASFVQRQTGAVLTGTGPHIFIDAGGNTLISEILSGEVDQTSGKLLLRIRVDSTSSPDWAEVSLLGYVQKGLHGADRAVYGDPNDPSCRPGDERGGTGSDAGLVGPGFRRDRGSK